jgi:glycosyltransferase involved in cell wall biosynthesis
VSRDIFLLPRPQRDPRGGVLVHVSAIARVLTARGWNVIDNPIAGCITHVHAAETLGHIDVYTSHGVHPPGDLESWQQRQNSLMFRNLRSSEHLIAVSEYTRGTWERLVGRSSEIVYNGVFPDEWSCTPRGAFRREHDIDNDKLIILWGKTVIDRVCDPGPLVDLAMRNPEHMFVTLTPVGALIRAPSNLLQLGEQSRERMKTLLADTDVYLSTVCDNHGIQPLEAMLLGIPILGYAHGGIVETVKNGTQGFLVPPGDIDGLDNFLRLLRDAGVRDCIGQNAREHVLQNFTWDKTCDSLERVYERVLYDRAEQQSRPVCSIVIPMYNKAPYIAQTLTSALNQIDAPPYEIIVVDDGSTDDSLKIARSVLAQAASEHETTLHVISQENAGVARARNRGIQYSKGKFITCLDSDDVLDPWFLARLSPWLTGDPSLGLAYSDMRIFARSPEESATLVGKDFSFEDLKKGNFIPCCNMFSRRAFDAAGGYKPQIDTWGPSWEDYELWLSMTKLGYGALRVPIPLFYYRQLEEEGRNFESQSRAWLLRAGVNSLHRDLYPPFVSFVIPCYQQVQFLQRAIDSVRAQTFPDHEIVIVDDGNSRADALEMEHIATVNGCKLVRVCENAGLANARNVGVSVSKGVYIVPLDSDDTLDPEFLQSVLKAGGLRKDVFVYTNTLLVRDDNSTQILESEAPSVPGILHRVTFTCSILFPREAWLRVGGYNTNMSRLGGWEDWDFVLSLLEAEYRSVRVPQPLVHYHLHGDKQMHLTAEEHDSALAEALRRNHPSLFSSRERRLLYKPSKADVRPRALL